ncbi:MAG: glycoside hydrolase family 97 catalytic domain-containing protein [Melioribacteraceae bacterium]|nr:glycoside hydrolase family 97 catalytic domain-containing protein [Melioribacteraceae bacterium]
MSDRYVKNVISLVIFLLFSKQFIGCSGLEKNNKWMIKSPNQNYSVEVALDKTTGELSYMAKFSGEDKYILEKSGLGITLGEMEFNSQLDFKSASKIIQKEESYKMVSGKIINVNHIYNVCEFVFTNENGNELNLEFRAFEEGFAYRYSVEGFSGRTAVIHHENTSFNLPVNGKAWLQPYDQITKWTPGYELPYTDGSKIGEDAPEPFNGWCFPMLFEVDNNWVFITEADLDNNNCGMHIDKDSKDGDYKITFPVENEAFTKGDNKPEISFPWKSSWRVIMLSHNLKNIFKSNIVNSLSEPAPKDDYNWIKPGRAAWSWWSESDSPKNYKSQIEFIDFAANMGWEYLLVDANWNLMKGDDVEKLSIYAKEKNVGLLLWYNSGGLNNEVEEEPRDKLDKEETRKKEFAWMKKLSIKGIKVDFFQSDKKHIIEQYHAILKDALDYNLLVNFHGCTMPRGWSRTYPNLVTMEAVRGGECYKFSSSFPTDAVLLNTIYPFTRNVTGPMDYTPVMFTENTYPHLTTNAHELATSIVFESGITHFADNYKVYKKQPKYVIDFLKELKTFWDESKMLYGYPGKNIGVARRFSNKWFIAGLNGLAKNDKANIKLDFLSEGKYKVRIISDGNSSREFKYVETMVDNTTALDIDLLPYGGYSAILTKVD